MTHARNILKPQPGFWRMQFAKYGPFVPTSIVRVDLSREPGNEWNELDRWPKERLVAYIVDIEVDIDRVWFQRGDAITKAEYDYQVADIQWCRRYNPSDPRCRPFEAAVVATTVRGSTYVDLNAIDPIF